LDCEDFDVLVLFDYRDINFNFNQFDFNKYDKKYLICWSMGVYVANLFKNMIEYKDGDILFKNPWSNTFSGSTAERKFLEYTLTKINANRFQNKAEEDVEIMRTSGDPRYYRVPLVIGDTAS
jgi:hypothetical protein